MNKNFFTNFRSKQRDSGALVKVLKANHKCHVIAIACCVNDRIEQQQIVRLLSINSVPWHFVFNLTFRREFSNGIKLTMSSNSIDEMMWHFYSQKIAFMRMEKPQSAFTTFSNRKCRSARATIK